MKLPIIRIFFCIHDLLIIFIRKYMKVLSHYSNNTLQSWVMGGIGVSSRDL